MSLSERAAHNAAVLASGLSARDKRARLLPELQAKKWGRGQIYDPDFAGDPGTGLIPAGAVYAYPFNEDNASIGSNTAAAALGTGASYDLTNTKFGSAALSVDATINGVATIPADPDLDIAVGDSFSISVWLRPAVVNAWNSFVTKSTSPNRIAGYIRPDSFIQFALGDVALNGTLGLVANTWTHVALVCDRAAAAAERMKIYVGGAQDPSTRDSTTKTAATAEPMWIGRRHDGNESYSGQIDDFLFYRRALTAQEVSDIAASG